MAAGTSELDRRLRTKPDDIVLKHKEVGKSEVWKHFALIFDHAKPHTGRPRATPARDGFTTSVCRPCARFSDTDVRLAGSHYITPSMVNHPT